MILFFIAQVPARKIGVDDGFEVIAEAGERSEERLQVGAGGTDCAISLVQGARNLVQVAADGADFGEASLQDVQLEGGKRSELSQMGANEERYVRAGG
jgi:hypothetical protein